MPAKLAQLDDPQLVRLYRVLSEIFDSDAGDDDPRLEEAADIMAGLAEQAYASGEIDLGEVAHDDLPFDLLDALAVESDPRAQRLLDLMRERGWAGWTRLGAAGGAARLASSSRSCPRTVRRATGARRPGESGWPTGRGCGHGAADSLPSWRAPNWMS